MDTEQLPLVNRDAGDSLEQQLSSYHKRQRVRQQRRQRTKTVGRATVGLLAASLVTLLLVALSWPAQPNKRARELQTLLDAYKHERNFSGVVRLSQNGQKKMQRAMGLANVPFQQPMDEHSVFPMGANVQLLVAVALYQLQEQGRVQLHEPVDKYWTAADWQAFGKNRTTWCPRTRASGHCERVTFHHLLYMGSGIQPPDGSKHTAIGHQIGALLDVPLAFAPGTRYQFVEANYVLLLYMVEQLSHVPFGVYLAQHVVQVLGLTRTTYDPDHGAVRVPNGLVDQYLQFYAPRAANASQSKAEVHHTSTGSCAVYQGLETHLAGLLSTSQDMHTLYTDLFHARGKASKLLTHASITALVTTRNPAFRAFAQGIGVDFPDVPAEPTAAKDWPLKLAFCGQSACATTCMAMQVPTAHSSIVSSAFTNNVRLNFPSRDAFDAYTPRDYIAQRHAVRPETGVEVSDGDANTLAWRVLQVFRHVFTALDA